MRPWVIALRAVTDRGVVIHVWPLLAKHIPQGDKRLEEEKAAFRKAWPVVAVLSIEEVV